MRMLPLVIALVLATPALAAEPAPGAADTQMAPALRQQLDALAKDLQGLRDALKAPGVTDAQRTMLEQHVSRMEQHLQMMQSGCCTAGQACPCAGDPSKCPGMQGGTCPHMGMGPGMGMGHGPGPAHRHPQ